MADVKWDRTEADRELEQIGLEACRKLAGDIAGRARVLAPIYHGIYPRRGSDMLGPPGALKESIHTEEGADSRGPYVAIRAAYTTFFMEKPAEQMHRARPFLSDAVLSYQGSVID